MIERAGLSRREPEVAAKQTVIELGVAPGISHSNTGILGHYPSMHEAPADFGLAPESDADGPS